jgi:hypothetical protein
MRLVKEVAEHAPVSIVNSINPFRLQGQKTAAFEIVEELGDAPDYHCLPVEFSQCDFALRNKHECFDTSARRISRSRGRSVACRGTNNRLRASFNWVKIIHVETLD